MESVPPDTSTESGQTPVVWESSSSPLWATGGAVFAPSREWRFPTRPDVDIKLSRRHNCGVTTQPLREVRDHLSEVVDRVEHHHDRVVVTRNGHPAAVILSPDDLAELEETIEVLSDNAALADIREADEAYARGDVVRGVDAVRRLRR